MDAFAEAFSGVEVNLEPSLRERLLRRHDDDDDDEDGDADDVNNARHDGTLRMGLDSGFDDMVGSELNHGMERQQAAEEDASEEDEHHATHTAAPLPSTEEENKDDTTLQTQGENTTLISPSVYKRIKTIRVNEWKDFNPSEWPPQFLTANGDYDVVKMMQFVEFCRARPSMKYARMLTVVMFIQKYLNEQCSLLLTPIPKGFVSSDPVIHQIVKDLLGLKANADIVEGNDMLADVLMVDIEAADMIKLICFYFCPTPNSETFKLDVLTRILLAAAIRETHMTGQRSDDLVHQSLGFAFLKANHRIGPNEPMATLIDFTLTNAGKTNKTGRKDFAAMGCHANPLLDAVAIHGLALWWRFTALREPFPDCSELQDINQRPTYRSRNSYTTSMCKKTMGKIWKNCLIECEVISPQVTHQGRFQANNEMGDAGVPEIKVGRHIGYAVKGQGGQERMNENQRKSYMVRKPPETIVERAGGDWKNPSSHNPLWGSRNNPSFNESLSTLLEEYAPFLLEAEKMTQEKIQVTPRTHAAFAKAGIMNATGFVHSVRSRLSRALLMAASRPLNAKNKLEPNCEPIYKQFPSCTVFQLEVFQSAEFADLVVKVRAAQDTWAMSTEASRQAFAEQSESNRFIASEFQNVRMMLGTMQAGLQQNLSSSSGESLEEHGTAETVQETDSHQETQQRSTPDDNNLDEQQELEDQHGRRNKKPRHKRIDETGERAWYIQSETNQTAEDFWKEYAYGINGGPSIRELNREYKTKWRTDEKGSKSTKYRTFYCRHRRIYVFIEKLISSGVAEKDAVARCQEVFNQKLTRNNRPDMKVVSKLLGEEIAKL